MAKRCSPPALNGEPACEAIIISVNLASGRFESSLRVPLPSTTEQFEKAVGSWLEMVQTGFSIGATEMTVTFSGKGNVENG